MRLPTGKPPHLKPIFPRLLKILQLGHRVYFFLFQPQLIIQVRPPPIHIRITPSKRMVGSSRDVGHFEGDSLWLEKGFVVGAETESTVCVAAPSPELAVGEGVGMVWACEDLDIMRRYFEDVAQGEQGGLADFVEVSHLNYNIIFRMSYKSFVLVLAFTLVSCRFNQKFLEEPLQGQSPVPVPDFNQTQLWLDQVLDHYDYTSPTTWKQRYYVVDTFFNKSSGPVILYICGEGTCGGVSKGIGSIILLAQKYQALILTLEHRFYGKSMPFGEDSLKINNLKYLNSEQALKDLAFFIMKVEKDNLHGVNGNPWISVGGSYPGALSAWFRYKYPHLTAGAIASSAVVNAIEDYKDFDEQIYLSAERGGSSCIVSIKNLSDYVESQVTGANATQFLKEFGAEKLNAKQFMFFWSDVTNVMLIQYGRRTVLCDGLKNKSFEEQYAFLKDYALKGNIKQYGSYYLSNTTIDPEDNGATRAWYFQSCTEFGWLQSFSDRHPMRSKLLDINFFRQWCEDSYGKGILPYVDRTNNEFGSVNESSTNVFFVNGIEDPWRWASLQKSESGKITAEVADCVNCAHCVDLRTPTTEDSPQLTAIRTKMDIEVKVWIETYWLQKKQLKMHKNKNLQIQVS